MPSILSELRRAASPRRAAASKCFFKTGPGEYGEGDRFLGISVPDLRTIARRYQDAGLRETRTLLRSSWHEARLLALLILVRQYELWDRRIAMVATYHYIRQGDFDDAFAIARLLRHDRHDLIHKAVGWMLREIGKRAPLSGCRKPMGSGTYVKRKNGV